ncbi:hepcidin [Sigmodon hispidus]
MGQGKGEGGSGLPSSNRSHIKDWDWVLDTRQVLGLQRRTEGTMSRSTQIQATCFLILLIASLTSSAILQQLVRQPEALQPWHRAEAKDDMMSFLIPKRKKRDSNFPICMYCCKCCRSLTCGFCCKT